MMREVKCAFEATLRASRSFAEDLEPTRALGMCCRLDTLEASFLNAYILADLSEMCRVAKQMGLVSSEMLPKHN